MEYSVGTWDTEEQAFTPQAGIDASWHNMTRGQLRQYLKALRNHGYSVHRLRDRNGDHDESDPSVLVERTDGQTEMEVLEFWKR